MELYGNGKQEGRTQGEGDWRYQTILLANDSCGG